MHQAGRHFLQIPGPSNVPDRILRAMDYPTIDHRGPKFGTIGAKCLEGMKTIFKTKSHVIIYPASGTGAWEAALVNTLSPGDKMLMCETGHFASLWCKLARRLGLEPILIETDWRRGALPDKIGEALDADKGHEIKAVCVVHNETSTGATSRINDVRKAMDAAGHPALLMVDTISSLGSIDYRHDEWGVDVTVSGSQKGLMLPPGLSFNAISEKALDASKSARLAKSYWAWDEMVGPECHRLFPLHAGTNLLYGLNEAIDMLHEEGLDNVFARHKRALRGDPPAVQAWGLEVLCNEPKDYSHVLTAVMMPDGHIRGCVPRHRAQTLRHVARQWPVAVAGKVFRIGHLGDFNDLMLMGTLSGVEMGLGQGRRSAPDWRCATRNGLSQGAGSG
jgi:alanine-glyoxylate transaminase/serine-glyoxylate transaminase/serine-pyruvate transaminase